MSGQGTETLYVTRLFDGTDILRSAVVGVLAFLVNVNVLLTLTAEPLPPCVAPFQVKVGVRLPPVVSTISYEAPSVIIASCSTIVVALVTEDITDSLPLFLFLIL